LQKNQITYKKNTMKALQYNEYGSTDVLHWNEIPTPEIKDDQVLVQVKAASINPTDTKIRNGQMKLMTMFMGSFPRGMGLDFAGIITQIGSDVTNLKVGDSVFGSAGMTGASFADYVKTDAKNVTTLPSYLNFAEACTIPLNGGTAIAAVNNYVHPKPGLSVLINGASGGVGLFIMQICKAKGATVAATCSTDSLQALKDLGADEVIDYKTTNVITSGKLFDIVLDASGHMKFDDAKEILTENGSFCTLTPTLSSFGEQLGNVFRDKKEKNIMAMPSKADLAELMSLIESGKVKCVVGKTFPMSEAIAAQEEVEIGKLKTTGKIVLVA